ncbi:hypothetical protein ACB098_05G034400 [Castanea mollissima]
MLIISHYLHQLQLFVRRHTPLTAKKLHAQLIKAGLEHCGTLPNTLIDGFGKCGLIQDALYLFDEMPHRDHVSWASILTAHNQANLPHLTLSMFPSMLQDDGFGPDHFVLASLVKACTTLVSWTAMISGYARHGRKSEASDLFPRVPVRNLFSWTAFISGLVQSWNGVDAFYLFIEMRREGVKIVDPLVLSSIVGASANLAVLELGKQIHGLVITLGYESCIFIIISNALVDMYAKCSDILAAKEIFGRMQRRDVVSWTSIIVGTAQHGQAKEALAIYDEMIYACSHVGLVSKGRYLFKSIEDYGINPSLQHYTCFLDLLSRTGQLAEAENLINAMPFKPDEPTWAALLSVCKHHNNIEMGIRVADHLLSLEPEDPSTYILLSNIYARAELGEKVSKVRKLMALMEVKKQPGYSCIELGKKSKVFYAGETTHSMKDVIFGLLKKLDAEMRRRNYVPDISSVLHDMEWQEKEKQLFWHSERLAVAYGLLKALPGTVIQVVKNLRVCGDCHTVLKFISTIMKREIVV